MGSSEIQNHFRKAYLCLKAAVSLFTLFKLTSCLFCRVSDLLPRPNTLWEKTLTFIHHFHTMKTWQQDSNKAEQLHWKDKVNTDVSLESLCLSSCLSSPVCSEVIYFLWLESIQARSHNDSTYQHQNVPEPWCYVTNLGSRYHVKYRGNIGMRGDEVCLFWMNEPRGLIFSGSKAKP